jgi:hypothetical protein
MILSATGTVILKRPGSASPVPVVENVWFSMGDLLEVAEGAFAKVLCTEGICQLGKGSYTACCTPECSILITMMRVTTGGTPPVLRAELSAKDAEGLSRAESQIREMKLGNVTTQFLITNLYSGWKIQEANQELNRLSTLLEKPEAKQELKELYLPVIRTTGDLQLKSNRVEDAKKLYSLSIGTNVKTTELNEKDAANEKAAAYKGLADAYKHGGDDSRAIRNLQAAKEIYTKQGEAQSAEQTEKQILEIKKMQRTDRPILRPTPR